MKVLSKGIARYIYIYIYIFFWLDQFPVIILASLVCFPCFNSVSYDFHRLILCKQMSNIIIKKILTAIMQYIFIHKKQ